MFSAIEYEKKYKIHPSKSDVLIQRLGNPKSKQNQIDRYFDSCEGRIILSWNIHAYTK